MSFVSTFLISLKRIKRQSGFYAIKPRAAVIGAFAGKWASFILVPFAVLQTTTLGP